MLIHRIQPFEEESVVLEWGTNRCVVNPFQAIRRLTQHQDITCEWSIVSMAEGLHKAGHKIQYVYGPKWKWRQGVRPHRTPEHTIPAYFLYGFALGLNQWDQFVNHVRELSKHLRRDKVRRRTWRMNVLEQTGIYYMDYYWECPWVGDCAVHPIF